MLYRCYLVACQKGDAVFVREQLSRAIDYDVKIHGVVIPMHGTYNAELQKMFLETARLSPARPIPEETP